jgi:hypothetical protein
MESHAVGECTCRSIAASNPISSRMHLHHCSTSAGNHTRTMILTRFCTCLRPASEAARPRRTALSRPKMRSCWRKSHVRCVQPPGKTRRASQSSHHACVTGSASGDVRLRSNSVRCGAHNSRGGPRGGARALAPCPSPPWQAGRQLAWTPVRCGLRHRNPPSQTQVIPQPATMAATNKCLARSNKSRTGAKATKKTEKPYRRSTSVPAGGS